MLSLFLLCVLASLPMLSGISEVNGIVIDGDMTDWDSIQPIVTDPIGNNPDPDIRSYDIVSAYVTNDSERLYFRVEFVGDHEAYFYLNITLRCNNDPQPYLLNLFIVDEYPFNSVVLTPGVSLTDEDTNQHPIPPGYSSERYFDTAMFDSDSSSATRSVEFYAPLAYFDYPTAIDMVFWNAASHLYIQDKAPDTGYVTYTLTPEVAIINLIDDIEAMNLQQGLDNNIDEKLSNALDSIEALNADLRNDVVNKLEALINVVVAQSGNKLTVEQADFLIAETQKIIDLIGV